ncbi:MAG: RDD family protein [Clostridia bacterium]|nr:RDD family protein [Clostridia bacterium]
MIYDLQRASMWKRISAFLFDGILLGIVAVLMALGLSLMVGYDTYSDTVDEAYVRYGEEYGVEFDVSLAEYESMSEAEFEKLQSAYDALSQDGEAVYAYNMLIRLTVMIVSIAILLAFIVMEFVIPLLFGNGQTLGKKIFGICLMGMNGVRISAAQLFIRTVLGKFAVETMAPVLIIMMIYFGSIGIVGPIVLLGLFIVEMVVLFTSRHRAFIHDLPAATVAVDMASQMIFESREALIAYKEKVHAEKTAKQPY